MENSWEKSGEAARDIIDEYAALWTEAGLELAPSFRSGVLARASAAPAPAARPVAVAFVGENAFTDAETQLMSKIAQAMNLQLGASAVLAVGSPPPARVIVALGETVAARLAGTGTVVTTLPPGSLLENPEAKKVVWADMKKVMALLGPGGTSG